MTVNELHEWFEIISGIATVGWLIVSLLVKSKLGDIQLKQADNNAQLLKNQADIKAELLEHQNELKDNLNKKHAENTQSIAVHQAEDVQKFDAISRTLTRMDAKLDRISSNGTHS